MRSEGCRLVCGVGTKPSFGLIIDGAPMDTVECGVNGIKRIEADEPWVPLLQSAIGVDRSDLPQIGNGMDADFRQPFV